MAHMYVGTACIQYLKRTEKDTISLELELQTVVSLHVGDRS